MNEIINKVFEAEEKAEKILADAQKKSSEINQAVQKECDEMIKQAREKAKEKQISTLEKEKKNADQNYEKSIASHKEKIAGLLGAKAGDIDKTASKIAKLLASSELVQSSE